MKTLKLIFALGLAIVVFVGCSKTDSNANSMNTSNVKTSSSPTTTTTTTTGTMNASTPADTTSSSSSSASEGETFTHHEGGIQFTLPANWKSKEQGEAMTVSTADDNLSVVFWVPPGEDFNKAVDDLTEQLDKVIKNSKLTSPGQETTHNGMRAYTTAGTGEVDNQPVVWEIDLLQAKKPVFVLSFASPDQFSKHESEYKQLLASIKKVD